MHTTNEQRPKLLASLRNRMYGGVVGFGETGFDSQRTPWLQVLEQHPTVIVNAANVQDIASRSRQLPVSICPSLSTTQGMASPGRAIEGFSCG